jgi:hypothetical protein
MKMTIESTPEIAHANGLPVRIWTGATERGTPILALITRVATLEGADATEFEGELTEPPTTLVDDVPRLEIGRLRDRLSTFVDEAFGLQPCASFDELLDILEREYHAERIRGVNHELELGRKLKLAGACAVRAGAWLFKDFYALYQAALDVSESIVEPDRATPPQRLLRLQLDRLRPAFEVCASERLGAPERLTAAEREALAALHRWLHSPCGDCALIEDTSTYHVQVEAENPGSCEQLDAEERDCPDVAELASHGPREPEPAGAYTTPGGTRITEIGGPTAPPLPASVVEDIANHEHVRGATDPDAGPIFAFHALRGAQMAWHVRHVHPGRVAFVARLGAPLEEPRRSAWLAGYRIAASHGDESESPTLTDVSQAEPFELTSADRAYYSGYLIYRAAETYSPHDRRVVAAIAAEDEAKARAAEPAGGEPR